VTARAATPSDSLPPTEPRPSTRYLVAGASRAAGVRQRCSPPLTFLALPVPRSQDAPSAGREARVGVLCVPGRPLRPLTSTTPAGRNAATAMANSHSAKSTTRPAGAAAPTTAQRRGIVGAAGASGAGGNARLPKSKKTSKSSGAARSAGSGKSALAARPAGNAQPDRVVRSAGNAHRDRAVTSAGTARPAQASKPTRATKAPGSGRPTKSPAPKSSKAKLRRKVPNPHLREILVELRKAYPEAQCSLEHQDPFQLLIATILSAQCTDARVNIVTRDLFKRYRTPDEFAAATQEELEAEIRSTGFFRSKARNIRAACKAIVEKHGGRIPKTMEELSALQGVGRKTANVVLGNAFNSPDGVVVDTHVKRITHKLALTDEKNPEKVERDLNRIVPHKDWVIFAHQVILHGRRVCNARAPLCDQCVLYAYCPTRG
jgi:endonuclease-3